MALTDKGYVTGGSITISGTTVTGTGTTWAAAALAEGDLLVAKGSVGILASAPASDTAITIQHTWAGPTVSGVSDYAIFRLPDLTRSADLLVQVLTLFGVSGNLEALAALSSAADKLPYFKGAGIMDLAAFTAAARALLDDSDASTMRTTLGVGTGDSPQFAGIDVGHASDTTLTRASAGVLAVEGKNVYMAGGTDVAVADGGTGASTAAAARGNLGVGILAGFRNKVINGQFEVHQVGGTPSVSSGATGYVTDQWVAACASGISCTYTQQSISPSSQWAYGRRYGQFAFSGTGASGSSARTHIEGVHTLAGQKATLRFAIADTVEQTYTVIVRQYFGTGGSPSTTVDTTVWTGTPSTSAFGGGFTAVAFDMPSISGKTIGSDGNDYIGIIFQCGAANAHTLYLANVELVSGDATGEFGPLERRHPQTELLLCARYYQDTRQGPLAKGSVGQAVSANRIVGAETFVVPMRIPPTRAIYSINGTAGKVTDYNGSTDLGANFAVLNSDPIPSSTRGFAIVNGSGDALTAGNFYSYCYTASARL